MSLFTHAQATGSYILKSKKYFTNGELENWVFWVSGSDGYTHRLKSTGISVTSSLAVQKDMIRSILTSSIEFITPTEPEYSSSFELKLSDSPISLV